MTHPNALVEAFAPHAKVLAQTAPGQSLHVLADGMESLTVRQRRAVTAAMHLRKSALTWASDRIEQLAAALPVAEQRRYWGALRAQTLGLRKVSVISLLRHRTELLEVHLRLVAVTQIASIDKLSMALDESQETQPGMRWADVETAVDRKAKLTEVSNAYFADLEKLASLADISDDTVDALASGPWVFAEDAEALLAQCSQRAMALENFRTSVLTPSETNRIAALEQPSRKLMNRTRKFLEKMSDLSPEARDALNTWFSEEILHPIPVLFDFRTPVNEKCLAANAVQATKGCSPSRSRKPRVR